jgi:hypothetical protein
VVLHIARRDWHAASELVSHVQLEMADAALRDAERGRDVPRESNADR